jgi:hypothetical protein
MPDRKAKPIVQVREVTPDDLKAESDGIREEIARLRRERHLVRSVIELQEKIDEQRLEAADLDEVVFERKKATEEMLAMVEAELADTREKHRKAMQGERDAIIAFSQEARAQAEKSRSAVEGERKAVEDERAAAQAELSEMVNREQALSVESLKVAQVLEELNMRAADLGAREGAIKRREAEVSGTQTDLAQRKIATDTRAAALELWARELADGKMAVGNQGAELLAIRKKMSAEKRTLEDEERRLRAKAENIEQWKMVVTEQEKKALAVKAEADKRVAHVANFEKEQGTREARLLGLEGRLREREKRVEDAQEIVRKQFAELERRQHAAEVASNANRR